LLKTNANLHHIALNGGTALSEAASWGHHIVVEFLLAAGFDTTLTPLDPLLHSAIASGREKLVERLLCAGAKLSSAERDQFPLSISPTKILEFELRCRRFRMHLDAHKKHRTLFQLLLHLAFDLEIDSLLSSSHDPPFDTCPLPIYSLRELQRNPKPRDCLHHQIEKYLSDEEFRSFFAMTKETFTNLPARMQGILKRKINLY